MYRRVMILFLLLIAPLCFASIPSLCFDHYTTEDGLSENTILCMLKDSRGFMWFGTMDGLNRFDGYDFLVYKNNPMDTTTITHNEIRAICEDQQGRIWIGTYGGGLNCYSHEAGQFRKVHLFDKDSSSVGQNMILSLIIDYQNQLWMGTENGLYRYSIQDQTVKSYTYDPDDSSAIGNNPVLTFYEDSKNVLWIGFWDGGVCRYNARNDNFQRFLRDDIIDLNHPDTHVDNIWCISEDRYGYLWFGTYKGGLYQFDPKSSKVVKHYRSADGGPYYIIRAIHEDKFGNLWAGTEGNGLLYYDRNTEDFVQIKADPHAAESLNNDKIYSIYEDNTGILWIGNWEGGINKYDPHKSKFKNHVHESNNPNSLLENHVYDIVRSPSGKLLLSTEKGLDFFDPVSNTFEHLEKVGGVSLAFARSLLYDRNGYLWVGMIGNGIVRIDENDRVVDHFIHVQNDTASLSYMSVWDLFEDMDGTIWAGTSNGLSRFNPETNNFTRFLHDQDYQTKDAVSVQTIYQEREGYLWIATSQMGLVEFDTENIQFRWFLPDQDDATSLASLSVYEIFKDKSHRLWVGTLDGLNVYNREKNNFSLFQKTYPDVTFGAVYSILEDRHGHIWCTTNQGIVKINTETGESKLYDKSDGVVSTEFRVGAAFHDMDGCMYFGSVNGFNYFYPEDITDNPFPPNVVITDFKLFNRPVRPNAKESPLKMPIEVAREIELQHHQTVISLGYKALNYTNSQKNQYAYKMEGFDKDWNYVGNKRSVSYTNLPPGDYVFRVKASNNDGVWNEEGKTLKIKVHPPVWGTWWFRGTALILIAGLIVLMVKMRERSIKNRNVQLEAINRKLNLEIEERNRIETDLRIKESAVASSIDGIVMTDIDGRINYMNQAFLDLWHISDIKKYLNTSIRHCWHDVPPFQEVEKALNHENHWIGELTAKRNDASTFQVLVSATNVLNDCSKPMNTMFSILDISARKASEEKIKASLKEKEVLLKEIHHRVKNNLQVIRSLLNLQAGLIEDSKAVNAFENTGKRILSMALVHQQLYESKDFGSINFKEYIDRMVPNLFRSMEITGHIEMKLNVENIELELDRAIPCGLLINELVTNALKHAFPNGREGILAIHLIRLNDDWIELKISDNGVGFEHDKMSRESNSLGLNLINILTEQLGGNLSIDSHHGSAFTVLIPQTHLQKH